MDRQFLLEDGYHELPEFLRFNKYGGVLTKDERERVAKTKVCFCLFELIRYLYSCSTF